MRSPGFSVLLGRGTAGVPRPGPVDFSRLAPPRSPNWALGAPPGATELPHLGIPLLPAPPEAAFEALGRIAAAHPRCFPLDHFPERRQAQWVARTRIANFPDILVAEVVELPGGSGLWLYSRSQLGYADFGVNRRRVAALAAAISATLRHS